MSEETKWTPGEWFAQDTHPAHACYYIGPKDTFPLEVATVYSPGQPTADANAHLIAAAPTMAEALMCWPLNELMGMIEDSGDAAMRERAKWFMEVRDHALAKARGETS